MSCSVLVKLGVWPFVIEGQPPVASKPVTIVSVRDGDPPPFTTLAPDWSIAARKPNPMSPVLIPWAVLLGALAAPSAMPEPTDAFAVSLYAALLRSLNWSVVGVTRALLLP